MNRAVSRLSKLRLSKGATTLMRGGDKDASWPTHFHTFFYTLGKPCHAFSLRDAAAYRSGTTTSI